MYNKMLDLFKKQILRRGYDYYLNGNIIACKQVGNKYYFKVRGNEIYYVEIDLDNNKMECDCPYDDNCKHEAACLYMLKHGNIEDIKEEAIEIKTKDVYLDYDSIHNIFDLLNKGDKYVLKYLDDAFKSMIEEEYFDSYGSHYYDEEDNFDYLVDEFAKELLIILETKASLFNEFLKRNEDNDCYLYDLALRMMEQCDNQDVFKTIEKFYVTKDYRDDIYYETILRLLGKEAYIDRLKNDYEIHRTVLERLLNELESINDDEELLKYYRLAYHKDLLDQDRFKRFINYLEKYNYEEEYINVLLSYLIKYYDYDMYLKYKKSTDDYKKLLKHYIKIYQEKSNCDYQFRQILDILIKENEIEIVFSKTHLMNVGIVREYFGFFKMYPDMVYEIYFECIKNNLIYANSNKYQEVCDWILDLHVLPKGKEYINDIISYIINKYSNRPSLINEISFIKDTI